MTFNCLLVDNSYRIPINCKIACAKNWVFIWCESVFPLNAKKSAKLCRADTQSKFNSAKKGRRFLVIFSVC